MFLGLIIAGIFPPMTPLLSASELVVHYQTHANSVRLGMIFVQLSGALFAMFVAGISAQLRRIEHRVSPALSYAQLALGSALVFAFIVPAIFWMAAAYRPERSADTILALHDMAWLMFVGTWSLSFLESVVIGILILSDEGRQPIFPRWLGFYNIWTGLLFTPASLISFFKAGPFAWNGLVTYWIPATVFGLWFYVMAVYLIKAISEQARQPVASRDN
jgi:hypothetical protein